MSEQWQIRRGTTQENDDFTGAQGELTMDTQKKGLRVHDGTTQGGIEVPTAGTADYVVEWQAPNPNDGYKWYRKYKSGWVEQGGKASTPNGSTATVNLPVAMSDANYTINATGGDTVGGGDYQKVGWSGQTSTGFRIYSAGGGGSYYANTVYWQVSGMAAQGGKYDKKASKMRSF